MSNYTAEEKLDAVKRELVFRGRVYPRMVEAKKITPAFADRQIKLFEEIAADYEKVVAGGRLF